MNKYKIDLSPDHIPYIFSLYELDGNNWKYIESANSITDLEETIKQNKIFPLYYE